MRRLIDLTPPEGGPSHITPRPERGGELLRATELPGALDELRGAGAGGGVDWDGGRLGSDEESDGGGL